MSTYEIEMPSPMSQLIIRVRFPKSYPLRRFLGCWLLGIACRVGGFKGVRLEKAESLRGESK